MSGRKRTIQDPHQDIRAHIEQETRDNIERGMQPATPRPHRRNPPRALDLCPPTEPRP